MTIGLKPKASWLKDGIVEHNCKMNFMINAKQEKRKI